MHKLKYFFVNLGLLFLPLVILGSTTTVRAQTPDDETVSVDRAELAMIGLPSGALRVRDGKIPVEIKDTLSKLVAAGGEGIEEGESEVVLWGGNYKDKRGAQMIQNLEASFKNAGWQYEAGEKTAEFTTFVVFRPAPQPRGLVGFFAQSEDVFVFAVAEMLKAGGRRAENPTSREERTRVQPSGNGDSSLSGKWFRTVGGGSRDWTGKTQYNAGEDFYFEFFPDGSVTYTREKNVLTIMQCSIKESQNARGRYSVSGNTLKIELGQMTSVGSDSCDAKGNFNKKLEPSTISVDFVIRKMESISRPDNPLIMCFNGSDEVCFEKVSK